MESAFTPVVLDRYIDRLVRDAGGKQPNNIRRNMQKLLASIGLNQPDSDLRELVPIMERLLPIDDCTTGLVDGIMQDDRTTPYSNSSKKMVVEALERVIAVDDVRDHLFGDDRERAEKVMGLLEARRKAYQNLAQHNSRAKKKFAPPPPSSSSSSSASPAPSVGGGDDGADHQCNIDDEVVQMFIDQETSQVPNEAPSGLECRVAALERMLTEERQAMVQLAQAMARLVQVHCDSLEKTSTSARPAGNR